MVGFNLKDWWRWNHSNVSTISQVCSYLPVRTNLEGTSRRCRNCILMSTPFSLKHGCFQQTLLILGPSFRTSKDGLSYVSLRRLAKGEEFSLPAQWMILPDGRTIILWSRSICQIRTLLKDSSLISASMWSLQGLTRCESTCVGMDWSDLLQNRTRGRLKRIQRTCVCT